MAQKAPAGGFIKGGELEVLQQFPHGNDDPVGGFVLSLAGVDRHDPVGAGLVHPADDPSVSLVKAERRLDLVPVVVGAVHAQNGGNLPKFPQKLLAAVLLPEKLPGIAEVLQLAAAAFPVHRAGDVAPLALRREVLRLGDPRPYRLQVLLFPRLGRGLPLRRAVRPGRFPFLPQTGRSVSPFLGVGIPGVPVRAAFLGPGTPGVPLRAGPFGAGAMFSLHKWLLSHKGRKRLAKDIPWAGLFTGFWKCGFPHSLNRLFRISGTAGSAAPAALPPAGRTAGTGCSPAALSGGCRSGRNPSPRG